MKGLWKRYKNTFICALLTIVCACFFVYVLTLFKDYSAGVNEQAQDRAHFYTQEQTQYLQGKMDELKADAEYIATKSSAYEEEEDFVREFRDLKTLYSENAFFKNAFYFKDGVLRSAGGEREEYPEIYALAERENTTISKVFQYDNRLRSIAVCAKTDGGFADAVVTVLDVNVLSISKIEESGEGLNGVKKTEFSLLCKHDGRVIDPVKKSDRFDIGNEGIKEALLPFLFESTETQKQISDLMTNGGNLSLIFRVGSDDYVLSVSAFGADAGNLSLLCAYKISEIYGEGFTIMQSIAAALLGLVVVIAVMVVIIVVSGVKARRKVYRLEMVVPFLGCATLKKFEKTADEILKKYSSSKFAFVSLQINNFGYVNEQFGEKESERLAKYVSDTVRRGLYLEETYGYSSDGEFVLLLHYRDKQALTERLNGLYLRLSSFNEFGEDYKVGALFAAYEAIREEKLTVRQMLDKLNMAKEASTAQTALFSLTFYNDDLRQSYMKKAEIEGKMEQALKNSEFHLFYQPKYNLKKKTPDGCEILVRWYDTELEKYHLPSEFLPVFEENGFIVKLDRFVFFKACENLEKRVQNRKMFYPISVNVSRVTAIQDDFIDYYVRIKNKFNIKDNFITLEFTESFAYENYEFLKNIVDKLHQNGLLCSIDDFGTGYSSYNILKTIEMDEIKLDKFFLDKGLSEERDQTLLESVIGMVKKFGMKVTQEGVETKEDLFRLEDLGCDVIQGYYFAKPMKYTDYCEFIDKNFV